MCDRFSSRVWNLLFEERPDSIHVVKGAVGVEGDRSDRGERFLVLALEKLSRTEIGRRSSEV